MDPVRSQDPLGRKGSWCYRDESPNKHQTDKVVTPSQDRKRPIRRVRSPSRPRAWVSYASKSKIPEHFHKPHSEEVSPGPGGSLHPSCMFPSRCCSNSPESNQRVVMATCRKPDNEQLIGTSLLREDRPFHKAGFSSHGYQDHFYPRPHFQKGKRFQPKLHHMSPRTRDIDREKEEWYEPRETPEKSSPSRQNIASKPFSSRSTSSRDKDTQFTAGPSERNQSRERDHRRSTSKDREGSREGEPPATIGQTTARDRAIRQKRREIDEVYYQECEMFGLVTKMLIDKDPSLEESIQSSLQENLRDIGKRCVDAMQTFIEDYDSRELPH